jgi:hypothetical protein
VCSNKEANIANKKQKYSIYNKAFAKVCYKYPKSKTGAK